MGITEPDLPPRPPLTVDRIRLRKKLGLIHSTEKQLQSLRQRMNDYLACTKALGLKLDKAEKMLFSELKRLEGIKESLEGEIEVLAVEIAEQENSSNHKVINTVPGFSPTVSSLMAVVLDPTVPSAKSWVAYTGLDISVRQSGIWTGKGRLTKRGNPYLRKRLYQAAWGACMNYPEVRRYYDRFKAQGRKHTEAVVIVARRLITIAFALTQKGEAYSAQKASAY